MGASVLVGGGGGGEEGSYGKEKGCADEGNSVTMR